MSLLIDFYLKKKPNSHGKWIEDIWAYSDEELEENHQFIQWLFPTSKPSAFNPNAPLLTTDDIDQFKNNADLKKNLLKSLDLLLNFWGFSRLNEQVFMNSSQKLSRWLEDGNHNLLRVDRVLHSLTLLGMQQFAKKFFDCLRSEAEKKNSPGIKNSLNNYWNKSIKSI